MNTQSITRRARLGTAMGAIALAIATVGTAAPAVAQPTSAKPAETLNVSKGTGTLIRLSEPMSDVFVADDAVADVQVRSPSQLYVFGKAAGETTIYATSKGGRVVYATNVRVAQNLADVNQVLHTAMPDSNITITTVGQLAVMNGTVASPDDAAQAQSLVTSLLNPGKKQGDVLDIVPVNRLKTATPLQVMLKVRIAEVNRSLLKSMGMNLLSRELDRRLQVRDRPRQPGHDHRAPTARRSTSRAPRPLSAPLGTCLASTSWARWTLPLLTAWPRSWRNRR